MCWVPCSHSSETSTSQQKWNEKSIFIFFFFYIYWIPGLIWITILSWFVWNTQNLFVTDRISSSLPLYHFLCSPACLCTHTHNVIFKKHNQNRTCKLRTQYLSVETVCTKAACSRFPHFPSAVQGTEKGWGSRLEAPFMMLWLHYRLSRGHIWNPFPAGVDGECPAVVNIEQPESCLAVGCLPGQSLRTWLLVKVFMCLCDHRYVPWWQSPYSSI